MRTRTYGLDRDTIAYANRIKIGSGKVLDSNALKQINKFVVGIKRMGLWNSMVCWPMRSIHNAGTGSTVYSLGGLGIYNGTMVNNLVWSGSGIISTSISPSKVITTTRRVSGYSSRSFFSIASVIQTTGSRDRLMSSGSSEPNYVQFVISCSGFHLGASNNTSGRNSAVAYATTPSTVPRMEVSSSTKINGYGSYASIFGRRSLSHYQNKVLIGATATTANSWADNIIDGANLHLMHCSDYTSAGNTLGMVGTMSFACDFSLEVSPDLIHDLYKKTLGVGLGIV